MQYKSDFRDYFETFELNLKCCADNRLYAVPDAYGGQYKKGLEEARLERRLINFRDGTLQNEQIGSNYPGNLRNNFSEQEYQKGLSHLIKQWQALADQIDPTFLDLSDNAIGNPLQFDFRPNKITTEHLFRQLYYLGMISKLIDLKGKKSNFLEIGAGYGGLCKLFFDIGRVKNYIIIDLPKSLLLEEYFLKETFPKRKVASSKDFIWFLNKSQSIPAKEIKNWDIVLLPPCFMSLLPKGSVDLVVNTHSLMEMNIDQIEFYYTEIDRICRKYFYQCNRTHHRAVSNYTYLNWPINLKKWKVVYHGLQWNYSCMLELLIKKNILR